VFQSWELWLREAGICQSLRQVDFVELHAFGCQPKAPNPLVDPLGYAAEQDRLRKAYAEAYRDLFATYLPEHGLPARFTVHLVDVPDKAASYEFYSTALLQRRRGCDATCSRSGSRAARQSTGRWSRRCERRPSPRF